MPVDGGGAITAALADAAQRDPGEASLREQRAGGVEEGLAHALAALRGTSSTCRGQPHRHAGARAKRHGWRAAGRHGGGLGLQAGLRRAGGGHGRNYKQSVTL